MRITRLWLRGNIRLWYAGIEEVDYRPESPYQLIVGTNGSGKSSLVAELNPNPGLRQDYLPHGIKVVELTHDDHHYVLTSEFSHGAKHTFQRDGVLLNDKGTLATQKELVLAYLNYNATLHELMTGEIRLSQLSPPQRREWISRACQYDVTYALSLFQKIKSRGRDALGARKHIDARLATEYANVLDAAALDRMTIQVTELNETLGTLYLAIDPDSPDAVEAEGELLALMDRMTHLSRDIMIPDDTRCLRGQGSIATIEGHLIELQQTYHVVRSRCDSATAEAQQLKDSLAKTAEAVREMPSLEDERQRHQENLQALYKYTLPYRYDDIDYPHTHRLLQSIQAELTQRLQTLPSNTNQQYGAAAMADARREHDRLSREYNAAKLRHTRAQSRKESIEAAEVTECPSCQYRFIPGVPERELAMATAAIVETETQMGELDAKLVECKAWILAGEAWAAQLDAIRSRVSPHVSLAGLWAAFTEGDLLYHDPSQCVSVLENWASGVGILAKRADLEQRIQELDVLITRANTEGGNNAEYMTTRATLLESEITALTEKANHLTVQIHHLQKILDKAKSWQQMVDQLNDLSTKTDQALRTVVNARVNAVFATRVQEVQMELDQLTTQLTTGRAAQHEVASLERQRKELLEKEADYKFLAEELSPTTGLIADQLGHCISTLLDQMNALINEVWTYDLKVLPCAVTKPDRAELDYRFPIAIRGRDTPVPDISKGSGAMTVMIDFVFVLVYLVSLQLEGYPLFPDELGSTFDPTHRIRVVEFFKRLVESRRTNQIFYISHNPEAHSLLNGADIIVLDDTNVPDVLHANRVIKITRIV